MKYIPQTLSTVSIISLLILPLSSVAQLDYGDAPDPTYPTLAISTGAIHLIVPGIMLGDNIDAEPDGQPSTLAGGDGGDEDGIRLISPLASDENVTVEVTASTNGMLDAWVDFNSDGDWTDSGEQIFASEPLNLGTNLLDFSVSSNAIPSNLTFARFRFSTVGGLPIGGAAANGEVEDYAVAINGLDFGDAPDPTYPTLRASDGARHILGTELFLGTIVDAEVDGQPNVLGRGDDLINNDDEDGVVFITSLVLGEPASIEVTASEISMLDAWIDYNHDGDWADPDEQIFASEPLVVGSNPLGFTVPTTGTVFSYGVKIVP